jgi:Phage phiEco32-like COOH.NH2 ligase-type 2
MPPYNPPYRMLWFGGYHRVLEDDEEGMLNNFRIGCDPEFGLLDKNGQMVHAIYHFPDLDGPIGRDHNGRLAEFHPEPHKGVLPIVREIQKLVNSETIAKTNCRLRSGAICNTDTLGGHVHFGFNSFQTPCNGYGTREGYKLNDRGKEVTKALDALTETLEHLDILPSLQSAQRRAHAHGYGRFGDVRDCDGHMEYRTMVSWLYDPKVAFLCLTAAKLAACDPKGTLEMLKGCQSFAEFEIWLNCYKSKDLNAARASEKLLEKGLKYVQCDPEVDFRGRWERLGL